MDGLTTAAIFSGFLATWVQIAMLFYKIGRLEQKIDSLNNKNNKNKKKEENKHAG